MPFTYHIESNGYIVRVQGTEQGSLDSARGTFAELIADPQLHRPFGLLIDVRALRNMPSREEADDISKFALVKHDDAKHYTALIVERGAQYGVARMIKVFSEMRGAHINIFMDDQSARYWLWQRLQSAQNSNQLPP